MSRVSTESVGAGAGCAEGRRVRVVVVLDVALAVAAHARVGLDELCTMWALLQGSALHLAFGDALRWDPRSIDLFVGPPIVDLDFYMLMEEQYGGVTFLDVNLSVVYGITRDRSFAFYWNAPWGLWPIDGVFVEFFACRATTR